MVYFPDRGRYSGAVSLDNGLAAAAVLADDLRRRMYAFIRRADGPVTRDQVAAEIGISRKLAAFHLDKLAAAGLLQTSFGRPGGLRRAGRSPKRYQPAEVDVQVSIPPREHTLLAGILVSALLTAPPAAPSTGDGEASRVTGAGEAGGAAQAAVRAARQRGRELGQAERAATRPGRLGAERALTLASGFLDASGFEPVRTAPAMVRLRNCPFHPFADQARDLICGINHAFLSGFLDGLGADSVTAVLSPAPGRCCVELRGASGAR
jgi:predicted ArsR family transcriptional regulator